MDEIQLFYYLFTINIVSLSSAGRIKKLNGPHVASGCSLPRSALAQLLNLFTCARVCVRVRCTNHKQLVSSHTLSYYKNTVRLLVTIWSFLLGSGRCCMLEPIVRRLTRSSVWFIDWSGCWTSPLVDAGRATTSRLPPLPVISWTYWFPCDLELQTQAEEQ